MELREWFARKMYYSETGEDWGNPRIRNAHTKQHYLEEADQNIAELQKQGYGRQIDIKVRTAKRDLGYNNLDMKSFKPISGEDEVL